MDFRITKTLQLEKGLPCFIRIGHQKKLDAFSEFLIAVKEVKYFDE